MLLAIPALRALARASPGDALTLAAQPRIGRLLEILGVAPRAVDFESLGLDALFEAGADARAGEWPARCGPELRRAARVVAWIGSREPGFVSRLGALAPGSIVAPSVVVGRLVWEHLAETVGATRAAGDSVLRAPAAVPAALADDARRELAREGWNGRDELLVVHVGAGGREKRWPGSGFAAVLEGAATSPRLSLVVHRGPADADAVAALPERLTARAIMLREPPLPLLAGVLSLATAYLGNDSGISHLAAAVGTPCVVLFGADRLIWRPWAAHVEPLVVGSTADDADTARVADQLTKLLR